MGATNYRYPSFLKTPSMFSISQPFTLAGFKRNYMVFSYFDGACNFFFLCCSCLIPDGALDLERVERLPWRFSLVRYITHSICTYRIIPAAN
jgi:hypothetical protein